MRCLTPAEYQALELAASPFRVVYDAADHEQVLAMLHMLVERGCVVIREQPPVITSETTEDVTYVTHVTDLGRIALRVSKPLGPAA